MALITTVHPAVVKDAVTASNDSAATCRDRFGVVDVVSFRRRSCTLCFVYLFPAIRHVMPSSDNLTQLQLVNGSDVTERYLVDSEDLASLDHVCGLFADEMGGADGCRRWTQCCVKADECCRRQRVRQAASAHLQSTRSSCAATWDGFSCWDDAPAGSVVYQPCPEYMRRADIAGLPPSIHPPLRLYH